MGFKKINFELKIQRCQPSVLPKTQFLTKTDRNLIFLVHEAHILNRLYIMVYYINIYGFFKKLNFSSKSKGGTFDFTKKSKCVTIRF
jgi:hypothetical protein